MNQSFILPSRFIVIDSSAQLLEGDVMFPFAFDEVLCRKVGEGLLPPIFHIWRHRKAFILGLRDRRLPNALKGMAALEQQGFQVTVRNSGGAAVPLDPGVVNVSMILPNAAGNLDFRQDFQSMVSVISQALKGYTKGVEKGEVFGSYCPGDYDLSIQGKKFCGIAQRRQTRAFIIQAFVNVEGSGESRGEFVKRFYKAASNHSLIPGGHPTVQPSSMSSLSELIGFPSSEQFSASLNGFLAKGELITRYDDYGYDPGILAEAIEMTQVLKSRYEKRDKA
jgi:octanoyl-[GcvH]:protein N-octanoyltransferase